MAATEPQVVDGRVPFADCPGDGWVPVSVTTDGGVQCPVCSGTLNAYDVRWCGKPEAMSLGWALMTEFELQHSRHVQ